MSSPTKELIMDSSKDLNKSYTVSKKKKPINVSEELKKDVHKSYSAPNIHRAVSQNNNSNNRSIFDKFGRKFSTGKYGGPSERKFSSGSFRQSEMNVREKVPDEILEKYDTYGPALDTKPKLQGRNKRYVQHKMMETEEIRTEGFLETARHEKLMTESSGFLEAAEGYSTTSITQKDIKESADITTQCKLFDLSLPQHGPYRFQYLQDGRQLVLAGYMGHLASFNWLTKKLSMEMKLTESVHDVTFLSDRHMIAVAQKKWTSVYDDEGMELHCVRLMSNISRLGYLRHHMLLTAFSDYGSLSYLDITLGKEVNTVDTKAHGSRAFDINPYNAVACVGEVGGVVSMWTPNSPKPVAQVLCHRAPISCLNFDPTGRYMATASRSGHISLWDPRNLGEELYKKKAARPVSSVALSQTGVVAMAVGNEVKVFSGLSSGKLMPYMNHNTATPIEQLQFCPYEDVLGISTRNSFSSILIPGSGESNLDSRVSSMFSSKGGRDEALIRNMLEKIPSELITLDPATVTQVDVPTLEEKLEARRQLIHVQVPKINPNPRYRMKGKGGSVQIAKRKQIKRDVHKSRYLGRIDRLRKESGIDAKGNDIGDEDELSNNKKDTHKEKIYDNILDRFSK